MKSLKHIFFKHKDHLLLFFVLYISLYLIQLFFTNFYNSVVDGRLVGSSLLLVATAFIIQTKQNYLASALLLSLLSGSLIILKYTIDGHMEYITFNRTLGYIIGSTNLSLLFIATVLVKNKFTKHFVLLTVFLPLVPVMFIWAYYLTSGSWINIDTILAILQTNLNEIQEYISQFSTLNSFLIILFLLSILLIINRYFVSKLRIIPMVKTTASLVLLCILGSIILVYKCRDNLITTVFHEAQRYTKVYDDFNKFKDIRKSKLALSNVSNKGLYLLVIGESHSRDYTSAYDYEYNTTPWLKSIKENNNTVFLKNAFSCHIQTTPTVTYALTAKNQYNSMDLKDSLSLLEVVEKAGFETVWLSNQSKFGFNDTSITVIADEANQQLWINDTKLRIDKKPFDGEILNYIPKIKLQDNMLVVIHLMGNHASYKYRYPNTFEYFKENTVVSEYNNSLRYTDYILESIYTYFSKLHNFQAMIYFSDHGEKPGIGHDTSNFDLCMSHIPVSFIFSDKYIKNHSETYHNLINNKNHIFTNDLIFNAVLGTMGIHMVNLDESCNDITSKSYDFDPSRFTTMYGKVRIVEQ